MTSHSPNSHTRPLARLLARILLVVATIAITFAGAELLYNRVSGTAKAPSQIVEDHLYDGEPDAKLGNRLKASHSHTAHKYRLENGRREDIYEVTYTTDEHRRRTVGHQMIADAPHLLLFGGSFMFGEGLPDAATLQNQLKLQLRDVNIYNYAVHGWGSSGMLGILEPVDLPNEVQSRTGGAIYAYLWFHDDRNIGSSKAFWVADFPYYEPDDSGRLVHRGSIAERRPIVTALNSGLRTLGEHSRLLSRINVDFARWNVDAAERTAQIIIESKRRYESLFDGKFLVLDHPMNTVVSDAERGEYERVLDLLAEAGVPVLRLPMQISEDSKIPRDGHPSALLDQQIARGLAASEEVRALFHMPPLQAP